MRSHLAIGVHAFDFTNRIKWCHTLLSAKQVNNEDLDQQLGLQTLTALRAPLVPIDQGFHAGSARLHGMINCCAQIHSYHRGSFVKVNSYEEKFNLWGKVLADGRQRILSLPSVLYLVWLPTGTCIYAIISHMHSHCHCSLITGDTQDSLREMPAVIYYVLITARLPSREVVNKKKWLWKHFILNVSVFVEYRVCLTTLWSE